jgi:alcohol dehydrogenase (NADP+)
MAASGPQFNGWLSHDSTAADGNMTWGSYTPKPFEETDVDIANSHCGVCGSDIHTLRSGWFPTPYPCVVGDEIVGRAIRVGVGAQASSCLKADCEETYCPHMVQTYGSMSRMEARALAVMHSTIVHRDTLW